MERDRREGDGPEPQYTIRHSAPGADELGTQIVRAVAAAKSVDVVALEPLYYAIDPDALAELFGVHADAPDFYRSADERPGDGPKVSFEYEECVVSVESGRITVERE